MFNKPLHDDHNLYDMLGIVLYGSSVEGYKSASDTQRHKLFAEFGMRSVITPQWANTWQVYAYCLRGYGIDNGAYICYDRGTSFDDTQFLKVLSMYGDMADWIAIPDVVMNKSATLKYANSWIKRIKRVTNNEKLLIVWQDGMTRSDLLPFVKDGYGVFIGGSTDKKLSSLRMVGELCKEYNVWAHCGRVNSYQRTKNCIKNSMHSCDGSGYSRFLPQFKMLFKHKKKCLIKIKSDKPFKFPRQPLDWLTTFEQRINHYGIDPQMFEFMREFETNYIGMRAGDKTRDHWYLNWKLNQEYLYGNKNFL